MSEKIANFARKVCNCKSQTWCIMDDKKFTVFDFSPTEAEFHRFGGEEALRWAIENGVYESDDNRLYHLFLLFSMRGDYETARKYSAQIKKRSMLDTLMQDF